MYACNTVVILNIRSCYINDNFGLILSCVCLVALFYFTLANIRPQLRSNLKAIQLIAAVTYPNLKQYGFEPILKPFIDDVNKLAKVCIHLLHTMYICLVDRCSH